MAEAEYYGVQPSNFRENETRWEGVVASGQVSFPFNYNIGYVDVWVDGIKKASTDFTATTGNSIDIPTATAGQKVCLLSRRQVPITAYPNLPVINNPTLNGTVIIGGAPTDSLTFNNATVAWAAGAVTHSGTHTFSLSPLVPNLTFGDSSTKTVNSFSLGKAMQGSSYIFGVTSTSSTGNALIATFTPAITAFMDGAEVIVRAKLNNTSVSPTLKVDGLAAKTIVKANLSALVAGDMVANYLHRFRYDAAQDKWILLNPLITAITTSSDPTWADNSSSAASTNWVRDWVTNDTSGAVRSIQRGSQLEMFGRNLIDTDTIRPWMSKVTVAFSNLSNNGYGMFVRAVSASGETTSGYVGAYSTDDGNVAVLFSSSLVVVASSANADMFHGSFTLYNIGNNVWVFESAVANHSAANGASIRNSRGSIALSEQVTQFRFYNGAGAFDSGFARIFYE